MNSVPAKRSIRDIDLAGRRVFLRVDYNVQVEDGKVVDDMRLRESLPTIAHLREAGASVILCSHRGRPRGQVVENLRNVPVATHLSRLIETPVRAVGDCIGPEAEAAAAALAPGELLMLENVRFHAGEEANDPGFSAKLARLADVYVSDAFGTAHRAHASIVGVPQYLPAVAGLLLERELNALGGLTEPERPFAIVIGGAKVADKIAILSHLVAKADVVCVGGAVANTFLVEQGADVADSLWERDGLGAAREVLAQVSERRDLRLYLPVDAVVGFGAADAGHIRKVPVDSVPPDWRILDIGPATVELFRTVLHPMRTVVWNGPLGLFEREPFDYGSLAMAETLADLEAQVVIGGGETAAAVHRAGIEDRISHISTGGGASLAMLQGHALPAVDALDDA